MNDGDCDFMIDAATVFFDYFRIEGWFYSATDTLVGVEIGNATLSGITGVVGLPHPGVVAVLGPDKGFCVQAIIAKSPDLEITFRTANGRTIKAAVLELCSERKRMFEGRALLHRFVASVGAIEDAKLLDLGGRARSGVEHSAMFNRAECTILDILPGDNVDVVGDAHAMSELFPPASFDAIFSTSVFEHLLMPWVVASEMSAVLRLGGIAYISTHQTLGMHDRPWDFWRFSDTAWDALFNAFTGFEIIDRALENPQYIVPHFWSPEQGEHLERAVGFVGSAVMVRKISEGQGRWRQVALSSVIDTAYPETVEPTPSWHLDPASRGIF